MKLFRLSIHVHSVVVVHIVVVRCFCDYVEQDYIGHKKMSRYDEAQVYEPYPTQHFLHGCGGESWPAFPGISGMVGESLLGGTEAQSWTECLLRSAQQLAEQQTELSFSGHSAVRPSQITSTRPGPGGQGGTEEDREAQAAIQQMMHNEDMRQQKVAAYQTNLAEILRAASHQMMCAAECQRRMDAMAAMAAENSRLEELHRGSSASPYEPQRLLSRRGSGVSSEHQSVTGSDEQAGSDELAGSEVTGGSSSSVNGSSAGSVHSRSTAPRKIINQRVVVKDGAKISPPSSTTSSDAPHGRLFGRSEEGVQELPLATWAEQGPPPPPSARSGSWEEGRDQSRSARSGGAARNKVLRHSTNDGPPRHHGFRTSEEQDRYWTSVARKGAAPLRDWTSVAPPAFKALVAAVPVGRRPQQEEAAPTPATVAVSSQEGTPVKPLRAPTPATPTPASLRDEEQELAFREAQELEARLFSKAVQDAEAQLGSSSESSSASPSEEGHVLYGNARRWIGVPAVGRGGPPSARSDRSGRSDPRSEDSHRSGWSGWEGIEEDLGDPDPRPHHDGPVMGHPRHDEERAHVFGIGSVGIGADRYRSVKEEDHNGGSGRGPAPRHWIGVPVGRQEQEHAVVPLVGPQSYPYVKNPLEEGSLATLRPTPKLPPPPVGPAPPVPVSPRSVERESHPPVGNPRKISEGRVGVHEGHDVGRGRTSSTNVEVVTSTLAGITTSTLAEDFADFPPLLGTGPPLTTGTTAGTLTQKPRSFLPQESVWATNSVGT